MVFFAACVVLFAVAEANGSTQNTVTLVRFGAAWRGMVWKGEYWRLFTSMFLHIGALHLVWNLAMGFTWTAPFERLVGPYRFAFIYLMSGLAGSAASVIGHDAVSAGASGALFGIIGGSIVVHHRVLGSWAALWARPEQRRNLLMIAVWLAIGPVMGFDSFAHGAGMLAGAALTWTMAPLNRGNLGAAIAAIALLVWVSLRPIPGFHDEWIGQEKARAAFEQNDWKSVIAATELMDANPRPELVWFRIEALIATGRVAEAEPLLVKLNGQPVAVAAIRARVKYALAKYDAALQALEPSLKESPDNFELLKMKLRILLAQGRTAEADQIARQMLQTAPTSAAAMAERARTLASSYEFDQADQLLTDASARKPGEFDAQRVELLAMRGEYDAARELLRSVSLEPSMGALLRCYVEVSDGQFDAAKEPCGRLSENDPNGRELRAAMAAAQNDCAGARTILSNVPQTRLVMQIEVSCLIKEQQWEKAQALLDRLFEPDLNEAETQLLERALAFSRDGERPMLQGHQAEAARSLVWQLLPAPFREAVRSPTE